MGLLFGIAFLVIALALLPQALAVLWGIVSTAVMYSLAILYLIFNPIFNFIGENSSFFSVLFGCAFVLSVILFTIKVIKGYREQRLLER